MLKSRGVLSILITVLLITVVGVMVGKSNSYEEPEEALHAVEEGLTLIPVKQINEAALFFFIKDDQHIGAAKVKKSIFGWKAGLVSVNPWERERTGEKLNRMFVHGDDLLYGVVRRGDERTVKVGNERAAMLDVTAVLPENKSIEHQWKGLYIWYIEKNLQSHLEIELIHNGDREVIDSMVLKR
ncbi:aspartyl-tRNA synthetase [Halobacillus litoralis]|uniref:Aspartyl-tRNA synthetase n=1 Tax=Halobacillus litoralis TaxID=45668 RepID=A0A845F8Y0_9BACI|nr:aspartyl-tRNA synthetase [Halobacillus litoralis]MYL70683.1 aspartyl-tRNA synthetase [Halobacillus litoralis]